MHGIVRQVELDLMSRFVLRQLDPFGLDQGMFEGGLPMRANVRTLLVGRLFEAF